VQPEDQGDQQHRQAAEQRCTDPDVRRTVPARQRMCIRHLAKQDAGGRHQLLKRQGATHKQTGEAQLGEHHPVEEPHKNHSQAANTALEQAQPQQTGKRK